MPAPGWRCWASAMRSSAVAVPLLMAAFPSSAQTGPALPTKAEVTIEISIKPGTDVAPLLPSPTLFLTAKPSSIRVPYASKSVALDAEDAATFPRTEIIGSTATVLVPPDEYELLDELLEGADVQISARLDKCPQPLGRDGDPNTRDAEDLVGRGVAVWDPSLPGGRSKAVVELEGRGLFGRLATQRSK
eukprot:364443-Chlamydomonas_euryale.AAC.27